MILKLLEIYDRFDYLFELALCIIMWGIGYFTKRFSDRLKRIKIQKILCLKNDVEIVIPSRYGTLTLHSEGGSTELLDSFVTKGEMEAAIFTKEMLNELGVKADISTQLSCNTTKNVFCIGGPLSNPTTASYFRDKSLFESLSFGVLKDSQYLSERNRPHLSGLVHEDDYDKNGNPIGTIRLNGEELFRFNRRHEGYMFLAKLSEKEDFGNDEKGSVHICFGNNSKTTYSAITLYRKYGNTLAKKLKGRSHYCLLFRCDSNGSFSFSNCVDITERVLIRRDK